MSNLSGPLLASNQPGAVIRTGTIVGAPATGETTCFVSVGGATIEAGVIEHYIPNVNDMVAVSKQDSSWLVIGAIQRTEWIPFTLAAGFDAAGGGPFPAYRVIGNQVYWRGRVGPNPSGPINNGVTIFTVPSAIRPMDNATVNYGWSVARGATAGVVATIRIDIVASTGVVRTFDTTANPPTWVDLGQVQYFIN